MSYKSLPYTYDKTNEQYKRLIVRPTKIQQKIAENGLIEIERENPLCEMGKVISACDGSEFQEGDEVFYNKIDRTSSEHLDTVEIDGESLDVVYENEIWCRNEQPIGRIFVEPFSDIEANDFGVIMPHQAKGITQKGRVISAPENYGIKAGDLIEFRKQEMGIYP